jgi:thiol:disulfide interchange protein DsbD
MNRALLVACSLVILLGLIGCGRTNPSVAVAPSSPSPAQGISSSADIVKVHTTAASIPAGGSIDSMVTLSITSGFHVNANPATFSYLIPSEVTTGTIEGVSAGKPGYPTAVKRKFQFANEPLAVYEGDAQIRLPLRAEKNAAKGTRSLPVYVRVQACDHEQCFPPATLTTTMPVEVK